jgi:hypothetical protein
MKAFLFRLFFFMIPIWILLSSYICLDPFRVIYYYEDLVNTKDRLWLTENRDYVSTEAYSRNRNVNSIIFGNSRSIFYPIEVWESYLPEGSSGFHFDAASETLYGIQGKLKYLQRIGATLDNALLVIDQDVLRYCRPHSSHILMPAPKLNYYENTIRFHYSHVHAFFDSSFLLAYVNYLIIGDITVNESDKIKFFNSKKRAYDSRYNEIQLNEFEEEMAKGKYYTEARMNVFYTRERTETISKPVIMDEQEKMLEEIKNILYSFKCSYEIIISPLYNQKKMPNEDLSVLESIFGKDHIHDFSGKNSITENYLNYYEDSHYRPHIATQLMKDIYHQSE